MVTLHNFMLFETIEWDVGWEKAALKFAVASLALLLGYRLQAGLVTGWLGYRLAPRSKG